MNVSVTKVRGEPTTLRNAGPGVFFENVDGFMCLTGQVDSDGDRLYYCFKEEKWEFKNQSQVIVPLTVQSVEFVVA